MASNIYTDQFQPAFEPLEAATAAIFEVAEPELAVEVALVAEVSFLGSVLDSDGGGGGGGFM